MQPDGIELTVLTDMDSSTRHWRVSRFREFDVAEQSGSSYLLAKDRGEADDLTAIPVFLHRRFRHGFIFINANKGINEPKDLIGKTVGLKNWQATALLWIRGTLGDEYGVSFKDVEWRAEKEEDVPFDPPEGLRMERLPKGSRVEDMLVAGELDAVIHPDILSPILDGDTRVKRIFDDPKQVELDYFQRTGIFPIMHTTVIKQEIVDKHPWVPMNMMVAFEKSKQAAYRRMDNPRVVPLAFFRGLLGGADRAAGRGPVGLRAQRHQPQQLRDPGALLPGAGHDQEGTQRGRALSRDRSRRGVEAGALPRVRAPPFE